jgi:hypothetical protein
MQVALACTPIRSARISPEYTSPRLPHVFTLSSMFAASSTPRSGVWADRSGSSTPSAWINASSDDALPPDASTAAEWSDNGFGSKITCGRPVLAN